VLTVDLGNSRLKALAWQLCARGYERIAEWAGDASDQEALARWLAGVPHRVGALSSVAGTELTEAVRTVLENGGVRLLAAPACGLENRCRPPEGVGLDRLYAAAGAASLFARSCIVVDAGTALTVDALLCAGPVRAFLGGAIAPGPGLLATALVQGTARLPWVDVQPGAHALGTCTEEAIQAGVGLGFRGAARLLVDELAAAAGLAAPLVVVTGGAREHLLRPEPFTTRQLEEVPDLVHLGLLQALLATLAPAERSS
jgi:type III pantothenate kinase